MSTQDFSTKCSEKWKAIHLEVFGKGIPKRCEWTQPSDVIDILNIIGHKPHSNMMFYPDDGSRDLLGAAKSHERGCIELRTSMPEIIKLDRLIFEGVDSQLEWNYFRIETTKLKPSGVYKKYSLCYEELVELEPLKFIPRSHWDLGEYDGSNLPQSSRLIRRYFTGDFVIFKKSSIYNSNSHTDDGRHEKLGKKGFRDYIEASCQHMQGFKLKRRAAQLG